jgi:hypothetical protein
LPDAVLQGPSRSERALRLRLREIEDTHSPTGFVAALNLARGAGGDAALAAAMADSRTGRDLLDQAWLMDFRPDRIAAGAVLYRGAPSPAGRRLLVLFSGRAARPMMPVPAFLQQIDVARWDVLLLIDHQNIQFRGGCRGLAPDFLGLVARLREISAPYLDVTAFGVSMGGLPAIRLALAGGARRAVSVGGRPASDAYRLVGRNRPPAAFDPICACLPDASRDMIFAYSGDNQVDDRAARVAAALCGGGLLGVPGIADHGLLGTLWGRGQLAAFLAVVLDPAVPAGAAAEAFAARGGKPEFDPIGPVGSFARRVRHGLVRRYRRALRWIRPTRVASLWPVPERR